MQSTKPWWQSMGVWGGRIGAAVPMLAAGGLIPAAEVPGIIEASEDAVALTIGAAAGVMALVGRLRASSAIG